jgi:hypothetical protein
MSEGKKKFYSSIDELHVKGDSFTLKGKFYKPKKGEEFPLSTTQLSHNVLNSGGWQDLKLVGYTDIPLPVQVNLLVKYPNPSGKKAA